MTGKTLLTARDLELMPDDDSVQLELHEGELVTMPPAAADHGYFEVDLGSRLHNFAKRHRLGRVYSGDTGFRLRDDTVLSPDVAFVRKERVPQVHGKSFANGAPDLAVEILSPSNTAPELARKIRLYLTYGCLTVWVFNLDRQEVTVHEASGARRTLRAGDVLEAPDLLPGFSVPVAELFDDA